MAITATDRPRRRIHGFRGFQAIAIALALIAWISGGVIIASGSAAAATPTQTTCGYADEGSGTFARTICWFDFSDYVPAIATSAAGQDFSVSLPGGYTLEFNIQSSTDLGVIAAHAFPTYDQAFLGNRNFYTGVPGKPALYQQQSGALTRSTISGITLRDPNGGAHTTGFALVGADAESTQANEYIQWQSDQPISSLVAPSVGGTGLGNACGGGFTGIGTTTVRCTGNLSSGNMTGTAIVAADNPTTFTQTMKGGGLQAFAFGVQVSKVQFTKATTNPFPGDEFNLSVTSPNDIPVATVSTSGGNGTTGEVPVLSTTAGSLYTLSETPQSGAPNNY